jgi:SAM-dependent methyltransferase
MDFDMAKWWATMSKCWGEIANHYLSVEDTIKIRKELDLLKPTKTLELGCGTGIWSDIIPGDYLGVDFSDNIIKQAKEKHPDKEFMVGDIKEMELPQADTIFTFTCFLHLKPEEMAAMAEKIKKSGAKYGVFCEPIREATHEGRDRIIAPAIVKEQKEDPDFIFNVKYTFVHDYIELFGADNIEKIVNLDNNRQLFIVKL